MGFYRAPQSPFAPLIYLGGLLGILSGCGEAPRNGPQAGALVRSAEAGESTRRSRVGSQGAVRTGARVLLEDSLHLVRGRRVGLVTNHTGVIALETPAGRREAGAPRATGETIDLLHDHPDVELVALFGPEHGLQGRAEAGEVVGHGTDERTGLPIYSLYGSGDRKKPAPEMLQGVDVLVFDIQDIGARYYTYVYTMALAMEAAGEENIPFVVLDRPNPIGGVHVQGNVLDPDFASFVGLYPIPMRHGMTPGELARLFRGEFGVDVDLRVVPALGWRRDMLFADTGLPWVPPSPNMPDVVSALHYPGTCLFEGTNLSVGRGTDRPFQQIGAPWLDGEALARRLNGLRLRDVRFVAATFRPERPGDRKFRDEVVHGVRFVATGPDYDPTRAGVAALIAARELAGGRWAWRSAHFDRLAGTDELRKAIAAGGDLEAVTRGWVDALEDFRERRSRYLIYR